MAPASQRRVRTPLAAGLCVILVTIPGCGNKQGEFAAPAAATSPASAPAPGAKASGSFSKTLAPAFSEGWFTVNNPWTEDDLNALGIAAVSSNGFDQPPGRVGRYNTLVTQYRAKRTQCEEDSLTLHPPGTWIDVGSGAIFHFQDRKCYPTLTFPPNGMPQAEVTLASIGLFNLLSRYGYYCGAGFPPFASFRGDSNEDVGPLPLDGVDYCCRLHDRRVWDRPSGTTTDSECGIAMCLRQVSGSADVMAKLPDVEKARQFWYAGAQAVCGGSLSNDAPPPILGP